MNQNGENPTIRERINNFRKRTVTIGSILPPYILIGVLFLFQQQASRNEAEENKEAALLVDFKDCVGTGRGREINRNNFYGLYDFIRHVNDSNPDPEAAKRAQEFADSLQAKFDEDFQKNVIQKPEDCLFLPEFQGKFTEEDFPPER